ncbi:MAG: Nif11-like leader peptide family natural product precursor, partial [Cyanobacteria bacterium J06621_11]
HFIHTGEISLMSKKNVFSFLSKAAQDSKLKAKLNNTTNQNELVSVAKQTGYDFSSEHVDEALDELKQRPGFFGMLAEAAVEIFSPHNDNYPATGVQPYSSEPATKR